MQIIDKILVSVACSQGFEKRAFPEYHKKNRWPVSVFSSLSNDGAFLKIE